MIKDIIIILLVDKCGNQQRSKEGKKHVKRESGLNTEGVSL